MVLRILARISIACTALAAIAPVAGPRSLAQSLPETVDLQPLSGSSWAHRNPGKLPFERCALSEAPATLEPPKISEPSGSTSTTLPGYVTCWAQAAEIAYRIPVEIRAIDQAGSAQLASQVLWNREITIDILGNRIVDDLFGAYQGWQASVGIGVGGRMQRVRNSAGVRMTSMDSGIQFGLMVSQVRLELLPRERISPEECASDAYLLVGDTRMLRFPAECGAYGEPVHFSDLGRAEFTQVR